MRSSARARARWRRCRGHDVGIGLVGEHGGEPGAVDVVDGLLRAGVERFAADDQPGLVGPALGQGDTVAELADGRAGARLAVLGDGPGPGRLGQVADGGLDRLQALETDRELPAGGDHVGKNGVS
jgi:hypothetical protein